VASTGSDLVRYSELFSVECGGLQFCAEVAFSE